MSNSVSRTCNIAGLTRQHQHRSAGICEPFRSVISVFWRDFPKNRVLLYPCILDFILFQNVLEIQNYDNGFDPVVHISRSPQCGGLAHNGETLISLTKRLTIPVL